MLRRISDFTTVKRIAGEGIVPGLVVLVYFADEDNSVVRKISSDGEMTTYAGDGEAGFDDGDGRRAKFNRPRGVAVGWDKDVYICDYSNNRVRKVKRND